MPTRAIVMTTAIKSSTDGSSAQDSNQDTPRAITHMRVDNGAL
jgi:hypothetical protein